MPLLSSDDASTWGSLYRCQMPDGRVLGYSREARQQYLGEDVDRLVRALEQRGLVKGQRIAFVGAAFGWVSERFLELGYGPMANSTSAGRLVNVDTSAWVHANKAANAAVPILNLDVGTSGGRRSVKQALGSNNQVVDWAVSEDVLPMLTDAECTALATSMRQLATKVVHWVSVGTRVWDDPTKWAGDPRLSWRTLAEWKVLMGADLVVSRGPAEVL